MHREVSLLHQPLGLGRQDLRPVESPAREVRDHEVRDVARRGVELGRRSEQGEVVAHRHVPSVLPAVRHGEIGIERHAQGEAAALHLERIEDVALHVVREREPRSPLHQMSDESDAVVRVADHPPERHHARRHPLREVVAEGWKRAAECAARAQEAVVESRGVREQVMQRHGAAEAVLDPEAVEVLVHVGVQVELAGGDELHRRRGGEELRDRRHAHQRPLGIHAPAARDVGQAVALLEQELAVAHHREHGARRMLRGQQARQQPVEERLHLARIARPGGRLPGGGQREQPRAEEESARVHRVLRSFELRASSAARRAMSSTTCPNDAIFGLSAPPCTKRA